MIRPLAEWSVWRAIASGFVLIWRRPLVLAPLMLVWLIGSSIDWLADFYVLGPVRRYQTLESQNAGVIPLAMATFGDWRTLPVHALLFAVTFAAIARVWSQPGSDRFGFFRLGAIELKLAAGAAFVFVVADLVPLIGQVLTLLGTLMAVALPLGSAVQAASVAGLIGYLISLVALATFVSKAWLGPATLVAGGRFNPRTLMQTGQTARLLVTFIAAFILAAVIEGVGQLVFYWVTGADGDLAAAIRKTFATDLTRTRPTDPVGWLQILISTPFTTISMVVMMIPASFVRASSQPRPEDVF